MSSNNQQNIIAGALTFPSRSQDIHPASVQPRQPRNLQGLLRFAMEATKAEDAPGNSELGPMDEERRKFLADAIKSLTVDVVEVLQASIKVLTNTEKMRSIQLGQPLPDDVKSAFQNILDYVDDIDIANDFFKMGGLAIFPICYGSENDEVRAKASCLLAEVCQNNPHCQAQLLECGLLNVLINLAQSERGNALAKCLYAISCASREYPPACRELVRAGGCGALAAALQDPGAPAAPAPPAARTKAAFLIRYLCQHYTEAKEQFINENLINIIAQHLKIGRDESTEHLLSLLLSLVEDLDDYVLQQCRDPSLKLKNTLEDHLKVLETTGDTYIEEKEYCKEILDKVFANYSVEDFVEEVCDR